MSTWKSVPLRKVADVNPPLKETLSATDTVSFVPMSSVSAETASVVAPEERAYASVSKGYTPMMSGDILVAKITPCFENGKIAQAVLPHKIGYGSTEFHVIRANSDELDARYVLHYLRLGRVRLNGEQRMTGSAGQRRVPANYLSELEIPLPPLEEQQRIAAILDQAESLRAKRRAALAELDTLTQSIFLDLFGDASKNSKGWDRCALGTVATKFSDGPFGSNLKSEHYTDSGVRVVRLQNIGVGEFLNRDQAYISVRHFDSLKKHECVPGDVLVGTLGDPNLRACIQPQWLSKALNKADCVQIRVNREIATPEFVCELLNQPSTESMAQELMHGQTRVRISMGRLRSLVVPVPPLKLQQEFARRITAIERVKTAHRTSLTDLDALFASLQHRAFRGWFFRETGRGYYVET